MNFRMEGLVHLPGRAREIDEDTARINHVHPEAVRFEPARDRVQILLRQAEPLAKLLCGEPVVEVGRLRIVKLVDQELQGLLLLG